MELTIYEIIDNMRDELDRARELLLYSEWAQGSMLLSDIESSIERSSNLKERIEFALLLATYAGMEDAKADFEYECDSQEWRKQYVDAASQVELEYEDGLVSSEWAYNTASYLVKDMIKKQ